MKKEYINPPGMWSSQGLISHAVKAGNTVYLSGQVAWDEDSKVVGPGDIERQAVQVYENLRRVLEAAGATLDDIVCTRTFTTNALYRPVINEVRRGFGLTKMANTFIVIPSLALSELLLEVEGVAVIDNQRSEKVMKKEHINPPTVNPTWGGYSQAVRCGNTIYIAGQVAWDEGANVVGQGDIRVQAERVFENLRRVLEGCGATLHDVVKTTTFTTNVLYRPVINEVRKSFGLTKMANTFIVIPSLALPELLLEVEAVAVVDD